MTLLTIVRTYTRYTQYHMKRFEWHIPPRFRSNEAARPETKTHGFAGVLRLTRYISPPRIGIPVSSTDEPLSLHFVVFLRRGL